jgi:MurNAc alpha-1-phosphate uridylyltransferase
MTSWRAPLCLRPHLDGKLPDTAMVMAAGLGKRMRPLTATRPKPLVEVAGRTLLDHCLDRVRAAGIAKLVVNVHYMADALEAHLRSKVTDLDVKVSDERAQLLETGGGLVKAAPMIDADPFFCVNSDNFWVDGPINSFHLLAERWDDAKMDALLLLVPLARAHCHQGIGDFHLDGWGRVSRRKPSRLAPFVFTGIQLLSKRLLRDAPQGSFSTNIFWSRAIEEGRCYGVSHQGLWFDVGTPRAIPAVEAILSHG